MLLGIFKETKVAIFAQGLVNVLERGLGETRVQFASICEQLSVVLMAVGVNVLLVSSEGHEFL